MKAQIRKTQIAIETTYKDGERKAKHRTRKAVAMAVIDNPYASKFSKTICTNQMATVTADNDIRMPLIRIRENARRRIGRLVRQT